MMRALLVGTTLLVLAPFGNVPAAPPIRAVAAKNLEYTGKLTKLDLQKRVILVVFNAPGQTFTVSPTVQIVTRDNPAADLNDLKVGDMIKVFSHADGDGWVADRIEVQT